LAHLYMLRKFNFEQQLWHKLWCYWEYLEEHIGNLVNMMRMSLQTRGRSILRTRREQFFRTSHPHPSSVHPSSVQRKRACPPSVHVEPFHRFHENYIHKIVWYNLRPWLITPSKSMDIYLLFCMGV